MRTYMESVMNGNDSSWKISILVFALGLIGMFVCGIIGIIIDRCTKERILAKGSFSERHPKLNLLIGLCVVICTISLGFTVGSYFFCAMGLILLNILGWLKNEIPKLDAVIIVTLITGGVSLLSVIISSVIAKIIEFSKIKQKYLSERREDVYADFVEMVYRLRENAKTPGSYTEQMMQNDLLTFSKKITLWGSPRVVNKWVKFRENSAKSNAVQENIFIMEDIMNEMRKDLGLKKVKKGNLLAFFVNDIKDVLKKK